MSPATPPASPPPGRGVRLRFGDFELDVANVRLLQAGRELILPPKSFALLAYLAQRPGELVLKDTLLDTVWGRRFVSEGAVKTVVSELRAALGDDARAPRWIETVQRRGYRFLGTVDTVPGPGGTVVPGGSNPASAPAAGWDRSPARGAGEPPLDPHRDPAAHGTQAPQAPPPPPGAAASPPLSPPAPPTVQPGHLPARLQPLIGRERFLEQLEALLPASRLVTVCGPAGVGKTSLALAVADRQRPSHADGVWWVELAPLPADATDAAALRGAIAQTLRIPPTSVPTDEALAQALQGQALLLVLDNAEHVIDALAPLVEHLQGPLPGLRLLVTSREPLQIPGEQVLRLPPLSLPAAGHEDDPDQWSGSGALQLFIRRVGTRLPGFAPGPAQQRAMVRVCRALDGLPLALELAAARVAVLGVHGLADHLAGDDEAGAEPGQRLQILTQASRTAEPRQRTLRSALDWSHALLKPAEQRVFRRLAVFSGGFTVAAAQRVCADPGESAVDVLALLEALTDKSMVAVPALGDGEHRLMLLESLREYALERLDAAGETAEIRRRHLAWLRTFWASADARALSEPTLSWVSSLMPELDNLRAGLRWVSSQIDPGAAAAPNPAPNPAPIPTGDPAARTSDADREQLVADFLSLLGHTAMFWPRAGLLNECAPWCRLGLRLADRHPDPVLRAGVDMAMAMLSRYLQLLPSAEGLARCERAVEVYAQLGDTRREYFANYLAWTLALEVGEHLDRAGYVHRMQALVQPDWNVLMLRYVRSAAGQDVRLAGDSESFLRSSREEFQQYRAIGAHGESWSAGLGLMWAEHDLGYPDRARAVGAELVADIRAAGRLRGYAQLLAMHTTMVAEHGDLPRTRSLLDDALPLMPTLAACEVLLLALAWLATHEGRDEDAARVLGWFEAPTRGTGVYGPRTYTRRTATALAERLDARLGTDRRRALAAAAAAAAMGDPAAVAIGLGSAVAPLQTDQKPTPS